MKSFTTILAFLFLPFFAHSQILGCEPVKFEFNNIDWAFPLTVRGAYKKHNLSYKPPGYYYRVDKNNVTTVLDYHSYALDFENEYQPKEVLFPREIHSYIFQMPEKSGTYDSLQSSIERQFNKKFVLTKGLKEPSPVLREEDRPFEYYFLTVNSCLTVGIKQRSYNDKNIVTVRFMYGLVLGYMGIIMGSY